MDSSNNDIQTMWTKGLKLTYKQATLELGNNETTATLGDCMKFNLSNIQTLWTHQIMTFRLCELRD